MADRPLLPGNSTRLELLAAQALAEIQRVPIPLRQLLNPELCPVALLPYLAWAFSVDRWSQAWPEHAKRGSIKAAYFIHAHKGTIGALRRVVEPLGYLIEVVEWWETQPTGVRGTFALKIGVLDSGITESMYQELEWLIDDTRPVSRHLIGLVISLETRGTAWVGACTTDGEILTVYPYSPGPIEVSSPALLLSGIEHSTDTLSVYP
ncbi:phage tail protein I [Pseudomonas protegens]|uniref:phage tail protein I n=1 Tax=Pseudomonas protegens TaxID=380021 RepID=UPI002937172F|nr:phage tail protein I [Pseudomonas protegens]WOE81633.1 phage tail protein I [Pseudomonas protegens]